MVEFERAAYSVLENAGYLEICVVASSGIPGINVFLFLYANPISQAGKNYRHGHPFTLYYKFISKQVCSFDVDDIH